MAPTKFSLMKIGFFGFSLASLVKIHFDQFIFRRIRLLDVSDLIVQNIQLHVSCKAVMITISMYFFYLRINYSRTAMLELPLKIKNNFRIIQTSKCSAHHHHHTIYFVDTYPKKQDKCPIILFHNRLMFNYLRKGVKFVSEI